MTTASLPFPASAPATVRLPWVDHLRTLVTVLVVHMHACVTYSHVGGWYAMSKPEPSFAAKIPFILWQTSLQSFFMGFLFFFAGYFAAGSVARRGPAGFVRERLFRLGLPALLYMLAIHPFILFVLNPWNAKFEPFATFYGKFLASGRVLSATGPLWFVVALLIFCLVFAAWRAMRPNVATAPATEAAAPSGKAVLGFAIAVALATFVVRRFQPIEASVLNLQLCYFPQYIAAFGVGIAAARRGWLPALAAAPAARRAGGWALFLGPPVLLVTIWLGSGSGVKAFFGGWTWQAFALALWEQLAGVGFSLGLLALFSKKINFTHPVLQWLGDRGFAVYVLHAPVLIALMMAFRGLPQNPFVMAPLLTVTGLAGSFLAADIARRIPGLRAIL